MTNNDKDQHVPKDEEFEDKAAGATGAGPAEPANDPGAPSEEDVLLRLAEENEKLKDQALRLAADMENLRRRTARDVAEARSYSVANFAREMLTVSDNLRRALEAVPAEAQEKADAGFKTLVEGVEMTERAMLSALEKHGVKKIQPDGEKFDPHFHQAMFEVPDSDAPNGTVVQVVQTGYVIGERVLRPALVGIAKSAPKPAPGNDAGEEEAEPGAPDPYSEKDA